LCTTRAKPLKFAWPKAANAPSVRLQLYDERNAPRVSGIPPNPPRIVDRKSTRPPHAIQWLNGIRGILFLRAHVLYLATIKGHWER